MLTNNPKFQKEIREYSEKIFKIENTDIKNQMNQLLQKLLSEAKSIDRQHEELVNGSKLATDSVSTHRSALSMYRQQLIKKLDECKKAGLIKE